MRLSGKLLLILEIILIVAVLAVGVPVWIAVRGQIIKDMQNELRAIAATAALQIDGELHNEIRSAGDENTEAFRTLRDQLARVQEVTDLDLDEDHIYTFYRDGEQVRFAVMLHPTPFVGDPYQLRDRMRPVFESGSHEVTRLYMDQHGDWISAYAPIRDSAGAVMGLLEVDKDLSAYLREFYFYTALIGCIALAALFVSSLMGWWVLQRLVIRPLATVREGILALGRRDFAHKVKLETGDEFEELADTFNGITRQLDAARLIQQSYFPKQLPEHPAYLIAGRSTPCDATGGDYYDAFALEDGRIALVMADVSGHGLAASLIMASCRSTVRALSAAGLPPIEMLDRLNETLAADLEGGRFITMIYGVLEGDGTFTYTNAGHGPALLARNGTVEPLQTHLPPVGVQIEHGEEGGWQTTVDLKPGDRLFLGTDGLNECMNPEGEQFGTGPIRAAVGDRTLDGGGVIARLIQEMDAHSRGAVATDDVTLLCVDRR